MSRVASWPLQAALALAVAACATSPPTPPQVVPAMAVAPFVIDGRLSARRGTDAISVAFAWTHVPPRDELIVSNPLGQTVAELSSDASMRHVEMRGADGRREAAGDWATLTERAIGVALPVDGLSAWIQGIPRADAPHTVEVDNAGRALVMRQDGCEIVYAYATDAMRLPSRLTAVCHDLEMRVVIDRWRSL